MVLSPIRWLIDCFCSTVQNPTSPHTDQRWPNTSQLWHYVRSLRTYGSERPPASSCAADLLLSRVLCEVPSPRVKVQRIEIWQKGHHRDPRPNASTQPSGYSTSTCSASTGTGVSVNHIWNSSRSFDLRYRYHIATNDLDPLISQTVRTWRSDPRGSLQKGKNGPFFGLKQGKNVVGALNGAPRR